VHVPVGVHVPVLVFAYRWCVFGTHTHECFRVCVFVCVGVHVCSSFTDGALPVHKATVVPRGMALGMVMQVEFILCENESENKCVYHLSCPSMCLCLYLCLRLCLCACARMCVGVCMCMRVCGDCSSFCFRLGCDYAGIHTCVCRKVRMCACQIERQAWMFSALSSFFVWLTQPGA